MKLPRQRWQVAIPNPEQVEQLIQTTGLSPLIAQVIFNRGIKTPDATAIYINPEVQSLPSPLKEFSDLEISVKLLKDAIATKKKLLFAVTMMLMA